MKYRYLTIIFLIFFNLFNQGCTATNGPAIAKEIQPTPTAGPSLGDVWERTSDGMGMVYVPGGEFKMGSNYEGTAYARKLCKEYLGKKALAICTADNFGDESPAHTVTLSSYWIDQTEVTNEQYQKCVQTGVCRLPENTHRSPGRRRRPLPWFRDRPSRRGQRPQTAPPVTRPCRPCCAEGPERLMTLNGLLGFSRAILVAHVVDHHVRTPFRELARRCRSHTRRRSGGREGC